MQSILTNFVRKYQEIKLVMIRQINILIKSCHLFIKSALCAHLEFSLNKRNMKNLLVTWKSKKKIIWPSYYLRKLGQVFISETIIEPLGSLLLIALLFLEHIFNPEVEILEALSMMELCRWDDVKKITEKFDDKYEQGFYLLKQFVKKFGKRLNKVGNLARKFGEGKTLNNEFLNRVLISVTRDLAFQRYFGNLKDIEGEIELLKGVSDRQVRRELARI